MRDITINKDLEAILEAQERMDISVQTLGSFQIWKEGKPIPAKEWKRDIALQLFQFFITARHRRGLHKEAIIDRIWENANTKTGEQNFKAALHGINKVLEPNRQSRSAAKFIIRQGKTYQLNREAFWIDVDSIEELIAYGNTHLETSPQKAKKAYRKAVELYQGIYLPNRVYQDWSSEQREAIQMLVLGAIILLSELLIEENPLESIRLTEQALIIDATWEDAYKIQMEAYLKKGNRPMAMKTYQRCAQILAKEFDLEPLPDTKRLFQSIGGKI